jgi:hypothetical protein
MPVGYTFLVAAIFVAVAGYFAASYLNIEKSDYTDQA